MVIGIDPGSGESAYVVWSGKKIMRHDIQPNSSLLRTDLLWVYGEYPQIEMVIEKVQCYGKSVGNSIFETVFWTGRFCEAWRGEFHRIPRINVKMHLCHDSRARDSNIRQALIDRFEPDLKPRCRPAGVLKGISKDCWQALALAVYFWDTHYSQDST